MKTYAQNPWLAQDFADFNFLCCPECAFKSKIEEVFIEHAVKSHPQSKLSKIFWEQPISKMPNDEFASINIIEEKFIAELSTRIMNFSVEYFHRPSSNSNKEMKKIN